MMVDTSHTPSELLGMNIRSSWLGGIQEHVLRVCAQGVWIEGSEAQRLLLYDIVPLSNLAAVDF